jgi:hypothetical protein
MGKYMLPEEGIKHLWYKLDRTDDRFIYADNLQRNHDCKAGIVSLGILYDGSVVPCLSERSWRKVGDMDIKGNILYRSLSDIWENDFKERRFGDTCKCCRDCIKYPKEDKPVDSINLDDVVMVYGVNIIPEYPSVPGEVYLYGVKNPIYPQKQDYPPYGPNVNVYGIFSPMQVVAYGVTPPYTTGSTTPTGFEGFKGSTSAGFDTGKMLEKNDEG